MKFAIHNQPDKMRHELIKHNARAVLDICNLVNVQYILLYNLILKT